VCVIENEVPPILIKQEHTSQTGNEQKNAVFWDVRLCGSCKNGITSQEMAFFIVTGVKTSNEQVQAGARHSNKTPSRNVSLLAKAPRGRPPESVPRHGSEDLRHPEPHSLVDWLPDSGLAQPTGSFLATSLLK
jgi:hypothetical protein